MTPFTRVTGAAIPLALPNIDTDMIIGSEWLKTTSRSGLAKGAFEAIRGGTGKVLDEPRYAGAPILLAGPNFGCGSSREHAAWALAELGIRAIVAPSFSDIFEGNAVKNGLVPARVSAKLLEQLLAVAAEQAVTVDLVSQEVRSDAGLSIPFEIDPSFRERLLNGIDDIELALRSSDAISAYERAVARARPFLASVSARSGS